MRLSLKSNHLVTDSTHCMIWNGFPLFLTGATDLGRRFHPFCLSFQSKVNISNELFEMAFTWIFEYKCSVNQIINQSNYLVCKEKNKHLLSSFEHLVVYSSCNLEFDDLGN